jgi:hypothetical protein
VIAEKLQPSFLPIIVCTLRTVCASSKVRRDQSLRELPEQTPGYWTYP